MEWFGRLLQQRWSETLAALGYPPGVTLTWELIPNIAHFNTPRGYGRAVHRGPLCCHLQFAPKILEARPARVDGVVRHELGHVVDFCAQAPLLDRWAQARGVALPHTVERRADKIAEAIWGTPIYYDTELFVQTTSPRGALKARPSHLGG